MLLHTPLTVSLPLVAYLADTHVIYYNTVLFTAIVEIRPWDMLDNEAEEIQYRP